MKLSKIVHLLGETLGFVIRDQEGQKYLNKVEKIRLLSKASRNSKKNIEINKNFRRLKSEINKLNSKESLVIARSFSQFLNFANLAESLYSVYKIHDSKVRKSQGTNEFIILEDAIRNLFKKDYISKKRFYQTAQNLKIDLVLTAHPTEVKRRTIIQKYTKVNNVIDKFSNENNLKTETKLLNHYLYEEITSIWKTDEIKRTRPTSVEEAKWGLAVIEDSLWDAVPKICSRLNKIVQQYTKKALPTNYSPITFGSWMGGDRDGNPNVNAKTTEEVVLLSRWMAANLYEKELTQLIQDLSMHECSQNLINKVGKSPEPYRVYLRPIRNKMKSTQKEIELHLNGKKPLNNRNMVQSINEVINPLNEVYDSLCSVNCDVIANGKILDLLRRAYAFGLNLAKIDIRQESSRHEKIIQSACISNNLGDYKNWTEIKKIKFLSKQFKSKKSFINNKSLRNKDNRELWATFKMLAKLPRECLGAYVVSMTSNVSDVLTVMLLQKEAGIKKYLRVVPLFETLSDLESAHIIIEQLYKINWYVSYYKKQQEVMIGYSDSGKDAGKFAASWAQYCSQEKLQKISNKYGIKLILFHGRGGSVGRGGGPVYAALLSQPPGTVNSNTRVTEQGEVIQQKFSTKSLAEYSLGTYVGSVLEATLSPPIKPKRSWIKLMDDMSKISNQAYRQQLLEDVNFVKYYNTVTPQKVLKKILIGSRPDKRKKSKNIKNLRAIPWVFAWTQIRFILPAWLGTLEALEYASKNKNLRLLKEMLNYWPFFYEMMDMLDMVLTKTDQRVIKYYEDCLADSNLKITGQKLRKQLSSLIYLNKKIIPKNIVDQRKGYRESVRVRNTYAETLNLLQANIMKKMNQKKLNKKERDNFNDAIMVTIAGIAAAMKNTG
tara:strand:- start:2529 stop:5189 length:2661 start_codon:yes stop_codon:yes gene_type:complete